MNNKQLKVILENPFKPFKIVNLTSEELEGIMNKMKLGLESDNKYITSHYRAKAVNQDSSYTTRVLIKRGPKPKDIVNHWYYNFMDISDYNELAGWVDDVLAGAARLSTGNSHTTALMLFSLLKNVHVMTTQEIKEYLNRKRAITTGDEIKDDSYCRWLLSVSHSAIKSLDYHLAQSKSIVRPNSTEQVFNVRSDAVRWSQEKQKLDSLNRVYQTNEELRVKLVRAGLNAEQINNYMRGRA